MYEKIESTAKRLEITDFLVELFKKTDRNVIDKVVYLTQGKLYPDYMGVELGIAARLAIRAISQATGASESRLDDDLKNTGDLGETAANFLNAKFQITLAQEPLTVLRVYETLDAIATASGSGSQGQKIRLLSGLIADASPTEAKYILRTVTGKMRIGIADMTILDALAVAFCGSKDARGELERAYNLSSDLGTVAKVAAEKGVGGTRAFKVTVGKPIRPMLAERLPSPVEILEKLGGECAAEYKYDGERIQAHKSGEKIILFSRRLENITSHYPDICKLIRAQTKSNYAIVECECVAVNPETGELLPFQELMHRRRKYEVDQAIRSYPVSLFVFDVLYAGGKDFTVKAYPERRKQLIQLIRESRNVRVATAKVTNNLAELEAFFEQAIQEGCEGLMMKSISPDSTYQAGARGWVWIKYKRDYQALLTDTLDLAVVGAFHGMGRRAGSYGALLLAAYDKNNDIFQTVCKCGSGFTDEDLGRLPTILRNQRLPHRHARVDSQMEADVWFVPQSVLEIVGSEITLSPVHTCAKDMVREGSGLAVRFPRFTGNFREDKSPEEATSTKEILGMYQNQRKKISAKPTRTTA